MATNVEVWTVVDSKYKPKRLHADRIPHRRPTRLPVGDEVNLPQCAICVVRLAKLSKPWRS